MKKLFLICLMMLASSAWAEWVFFDASDSAIHYFDPATIRKDRHIRRVWVLTDLRVRHKDGEMSRRVRYEYDCKQERYKFLTISEHSEPMAGGETLAMTDESNYWTSIAPDTIDETMLKIVCSK